MAHEHGLLRIATLTRRDLGIYRLPGGDGLENLLQPWGDCGCLLAVAPAIVSAKRPTLVIPAAAHRRSGLLPRPIRWLLPLTPQRPFPG